MRIRILLWLLLSVYTTSSFSQITKSERRDFARFDYTDGKSDFYQIDLSQLKGEFERCYFYSEASNQKLYIADKKNFYNEYAYFTYKKGAF